MATGSYEGSLSVEDTSGRHEPSAFTSRWSRRPWRLPHADKGANATARLELETSAGRHDEGRAGAAQEGVATEVSEAWSEQAPWEENAHALEVTPGHGQVNARGNKRQRVSRTDPPKRSRVP
jgi:hypothetical protein